MDHYEQIKSAQLRFRVNLCDVFKVSNIIPYFNWVMLSKVQEYIGTLHCYLPAHAKNGIALLLCVF